MKAKSKCIAMVICYCAGPFLWQSAACQTLHESQMVAESATTLLNPWEVEQQSFSAGNYLAPLLSLRSKAEEYLISAQKQRYLQAIGTLESFVENNADAEQHFSAFRQLQGSRLALNASPTEEFFAKDAVAEIIGSTQGRRVVFINEAHHVPAHRALTTRLLSTFWRSGFRYFAAETLSTADRGLQERKYPLFDLTGFYTNEPFYGDLVRQALKLGFKVVAYDATEPCTSPAEKPAFCLNQRERAQAQKLYTQTLAQDPSAKILVHAGYGHIDKIGSADWMPMAVHFQQISSIEPFSIDQTLSLEIGVKKPSIFKSGDGSYWKEPNIGTGYDLQVIHPRDLKNFNRPVWTSVGGHRLPWRVANSLCRDNYPCLVQAFVAEEGTKAVPMDQLEIGAPLYDAILMLPAGTYLIRALSKEGSQIGSLATVVVQ